MVYALYKQRCCDKANKAFAFLTHFDRQSCKKAAARPRAAQKKVTKHTEMWYTVY